MDPHIRQISISDIIGPPFMSRFMYDDEVKHEAPSTGTQITTQVSFHIFISIGHTTLMFHPQIRDFDQLISIFIKRVRTKPIFKSLQHPQRIPKMVLGLIKDRKSTRQNSSNVTISYTI